MKTINTYALIFSLIFLQNWVKAQTTPSSDEIYDLVSANVPSAFTLNNGQCGFQKYFLKSLYFVDQTEERGKPQILVGCKQFESMVQPLAQIEFKLRKHFKTHYHLKNLNLVVADVLKNALFDHSASALMAPWFFDAGMVNVNLKNPQTTLPIVIHEYAHYIIHSNFPVFNFTGREKTDLVFYFDALHELMSDLMVVIDTQDPNIMVKALQSTRSLQYPNGKASTDIFVQERPSSSKDSKFFKYLLTARDFDDRKNELDYIIPRMRTGDKVIIQGYFYAPHSLLAPVRKFLWDHAISNPVLRQKLGTAGLTKFLFQELAMFYTQMLRNQHRPHQDPIVAFESINRQLMLWFKPKLAPTSPNL
jgi:hypothetical protein